MSNSHLTKKSPLIHPMKDIGNSMLERLKNVFEGNLHYLCQLIFADEDETVTIIGGEKDP